MPARGEKKNEHRRKKKGKTAGGGFFFFANKGTFSRDCCLLMLRAAAVRSPPSPQSPTQEYLSLMIPLCCKGATKVVGKREGRGKRGSYGITRVNEITWARVTPYRMRIGGNWLPSGALQTLLHQSRTCGERARMRRLAESGGGAYMERKRLVTGFGEYLQGGGRNRTADDST